MLMMVWCTQGEGETRPQEMATPEIVSAHLRAYDDGPGGHPKIWSFWLSHRPLVTLPFSPHPLGSSADCRI